MYRVAFVDPQTSTRATLRALLLSMESVRLDAECEDYDLFVQVAFQWRPDVAIVALDADCPRALQLIVELAAIFPGVRILAVVPRLDPTLLFEVVRRGASGYLSQPITLQRLQAALAGRPGMADADYEVPAAECEIEEPAAAAAADEDVLGHDVVDLLMGADEPTAQPASGTRSDKAKTLGEETLAEDALFTAPPDAETEAEGEAEGIAACEEECEETSFVPFPPQRLLPRLLRGLQQTSKRLWRGLPFAGAVGDLVDCTVFAPPVVAAGEFILVQVFAHLPEQASIARRYAREFDATAARRGFKSLEAEVERGSKLTFHLVMPGTEFDDAVQHLVWHGTPESVQFDIEVPWQPPRNLIGTVSVSQESIPIGHVKFKLTVRPKRARARPRHSLEPVGETAHRYRKAFISYASQDRQEVVKRVQMLARLGIDYFQDVLNLEPGQRWQKQLYRHIDESDLFLLFWSTAARNSEWVQKEVRYALQRKGGDDFALPEITPVVIEGPPPPAPPAELAHLHFNDYLLYFMIPPPHRAQPK